MKNNDNPALLAHKQAVDADRRAIAENKRRAKRLVNAERMLRIANAGRAS